MFKHSRRAAAIATVVALITPIALLAHAVVFPKTSTTSGYERYVLRVPNEKNSATIKVELHFSSELRVTSFEDVPGWTLSIQTDSAKRIVGATWTGSLAPERFVEFPFLAANPKTATTLSWPAYQTYADGERVEWTGAAGTKTPASTTVIAAAPTPAAAAPQWQQWLPWGAIVLAMLSLGIALRPHRS